MIITHRRDRIVYRTSRLLNFGVSLFSGSDRRGSVKRSIDIGLQIAKDLYSCAAFLSLSETNSRGLRLMYRDLEN